MNKKINNNPTAHITINKSRLKQYNKNSDVPVYYLSKSSEFQIELFNPTRDTIMAKIFLNGKPIAQGGLVLKPAQRVFLDRYIDVAKKFKFDTYEVANTSESRNAIEDNGDFRVEFYKEQTPIDYNPPYYINNANPNLFGGTYYNDDYSTFNTTSLGNLNNTSIGDLTNGSTNVSNLSDAGPTLDFMDHGTLKSDSTPINNNFRKRKKNLKSKKGIETGRVEAGADSKQTLTTVYMNWESVAFHSIEYKMQPISQKVNTVGDIRVKRYCTSCGVKQKPTFKFCPSCGNEV